MPKAKALTFNPERPTRRYSILPTRFLDAKKALDVSLDYLRDYYLDLDDCAEWGRYQYMQDQVMGWNLKPIKRLPVKVATLEGLYVASATTEGKTAWTDREAEAAIDAVNLMEQEFGDFFRSRSAALRV